MTVRSTSKRRVCGFNPWSGTKVPHASWPKTQNREQYCNKFSKTFKMEGKGSLKIKQKQVKTHTDLPYDLAIPRQGMYIPKNQKRRLIQTHVNTCSQQRYSPWAKNGSKPSVHQWINKWLYNRSDVCRYASSHTKERSLRYITARMNLENSREIS